MYVHVIAGPLAFEWNNGLFHWCWGDPRDAATLWVKDTRRFDRYTGNTTGRMLGAWLWRVDHRRLDHRRAR